MTGRIAILTLGLGLAGIVYSASHRDLQDAVYRRSAQFDAALHGVDRRFEGIAVSLDNMVRRAAQLPRPALRRAEAFFTPVLHAAHIRVYFVILLVVLGVVIALRLGRNA